MQYSPRERDIVSRFLFAREEMCRVVERMRREGEGGKALRALGEGILVCLKRNEMFCPGRRSFTKATSEARNQRGTQTPGQDSRSHQVSCGYLW
jgi:hypothetical protein